MKKIIQISLFVLFAIAMSGLMGFIYVEQGKLPLKDVVININHTDEKGFLNNNAVKKLIPGFDSIQKTSAKQLNISSIKSVSELQ